MTKPYNTDIAHVWSRVSRSFARKGQAFKKDGFITKKKEPNPNYTGSKAGAKLRGEHKLNKKAREWRTAYLKALELESEADLGAECLQKLADEEGVSMEEIADGINEANKEERDANKAAEHADALDATRVDLFNAILDDKPHDSKEAVDTLLKDKLADGIAGYKSALALKMFNPQPEAEEKPTESEPEGKEEVEAEETEPVDETLRAPGKSNQDVVADGPVKGKKKK